MVFCDESAATERILDHKRGWAPTGTIYRTKITAKRTKRRSILPALTMNGYIACRVYRNSYNQDRFKEFIRDEVLL